VVLDGCLQWVVQGAVDVDIGANPSAEGGGEDEGVDDQAVKVVDIVDTFRLQVLKVTMLAKLITLNPLDDLITVLSIFHHFIIIMSKILRCIKRFTYLVLGLLVSHEVQSLHSSPAYSMKKVHYYYLVLNHFY
jgi:hypothetical protein